MTKYDTKNKVKEPDEVMMSTNKYRKAQDLIREFYEARIQITTDKRDRMLKKDILSEFRTWLKANTMEKLYLNLQNYMNLLRKNLNKNIQRAVVGDFLHLRMKIIVAKKKIILMYNLFKKIFIYKLIKYK